MKRILALILILAFLIVLVSCDNGQQLPDTNTDAVTQDTAKSDNTTEESTTEAITEAQIELDPSVDSLLAKITQKMAAADNYVIFSVGDSVTEGHGASSPDFTFTAQFAKMLGEQFSDKTILRIDGEKNSDKTAIIYPETSITVQNGTNGKITVVRCGIGGDTIKKITDRSTDFIGKEIDGQTGNLFIISSGINDAGMNNPQTYAPPAKYAQNINALLDKIYATHPDADIILMTPTYFGDGTTLDKYSDAMKKVAADRNVAIIDQHQLWMDHKVEGAEHYGQGDWLTNDDCHPSDIGCEAMAKEMIRALFGNTAK